MKRIKMKVLAASPAGAFQAGSVRVVDDKEADSLVKDGYAELLPDAKPEQKSATKPEPETATAPEPEENTMMPPPRRRRRKSEEVQRLSGEVPE
jgi:hypothetical protein